MVKKLMPPGHGNSMIRQVACGRWVDPQVASGSALETGTGFLCPDVGAPNDDHATDRDNGGARPHHCRLRSEQSAPSKLRWMLSDPGERYAPAFQVNKEQNVIRDQPSPRQHVNR